jgi:hypothetical protein
MKSRKRKSAPVARLKTLGIVWYEPQEYDRWKSIFPDADILPDTYQDWLEKARMAVATLGTVKK